MRVAGGRAGGITKVRSTRMHRMKSSIFHEPSASSKPGAGHFSGSAALYHVFHAGACASTTLTT